MTAARSYAHPTLVGIYDPSASLHGCDEISVAMARACPGAADVVTTHQLVAARSPRGSSSNGGVACLLVGRVYSVGDLRAYSAPERGEEPERLIAAAYRHRGQAVLDALSGNFVLMVWDANARRGFVAQDQVGGRSLYYYARGNRLYFASDIAPLLRLLPARPGPDELTLIHHIANSEGPMERTVYEGVLRLCAGHLIEFAPEGWRRRRYWAPQYRPRQRASRSELQERYWDAVSTAVRRRMVDAAPLGIIMSGGLDSTTVAAAAMDGVRDGLPTPRGYSAVFPERPQVNESDRINLLADSLGLASIQIEPQPGGIFPLLLDYMRAWDVPLTGPGYILERPLIERAASDGIAVLLDGQGGDELFGLSPFLVADRIRRGRLLSSFRLARRFPLGIEHPPLRKSLKLWKIFGLKVALPYRWHEALHRAQSSPDRAHLLPQAAQLSAETQSALDWKRNRNGPLWWAYKASLLAEGREKTYLAEYLRHRAAMAGMEARPPFIDLELIQFALSYPPQLDFDSRYDRPNIRGALRNRVPDALRLDRRKSNLGPFYHEGWIGPDLPLIRQMLLGRNVHVRRYVTREAIEELLSNPPSVGARKYLLFGTRVWCLIAVECFLRYQEDPVFGERLRASPEFVPPRSRLVQKPIAAVS